MPEQHVWLELNGHMLAHNFLLRENWQAVDVNLPEAMLRNGLNRLTFHFSHAAQPRQVLPEATAIGQTGLQTPVDLEVNSGGDFAFITVGFGQGAVDASAHRRGLNVAVVGSQSGEVKSIKGFDTAANAYEANALVQFIADIPDGEIVVVATQGLDAAAFFNAEVISSLQQLGLAADELTLPFSAIGVKNAASGSALVASGENSAYLRLGGSPDTRNLAAAVDWVTISAPPLKSAQDKE